jgi:hypothetical protein
MTEGSIASARRVVEYGIVARLPPSHGAKIEMVGGRTLAEVVGYESDAPAEGPELIQGMTFA